MSNNIDDEVVSLKFDNKQFEEGVSSTMSSLEKLKSSLSFSGKTGLDDVQSSANSLSFDSAEESAHHFSAGLIALGTIGVTALSKLTSSVIDTTKAFLDQFSTLGAAKAGFATYESSINAARTLIAGTGKSLPQVNKVLNQLNDYAVDTVYSLSDMYDNIGKFTNAGVPLKKARDAMIGIDNAAAVAGADANEAARAMYNFAQALSTGAVKAIDWKSIENANLATKGFKQTIIDTAVEVGTLTKVNGKYTTAAGHSLTATKGFREALQDGFFSSKVLIESLNKYSDKTTKFGKAAFNSAKQLTTFSKLMDNLQETMSQGWSKTWGIVIGNLDEATDLFTKIGDKVGGFLGDNAAMRNQLLKDWKKLGGRKDLIQGLADAFGALFDIVKPIRDAFRDVFPPTTAEQLAGMTKTFANFTNGLRLSEPTMDNIRHIFRGLFSVLSIGGNIIKNVVGYFTSLIGLFVGHGGTGSILSVAAAFADVATKLNEWLVQSGAIDKFFKGLEAGRAKVLGPIIDAVSKVVQALVRLGKAAAPALLDKFSGATVKMGDVLDKASQKISELFSYLSDGAVSGIDKLSAVISNVKIFGKSVSDEAQNVSGKFEGISKSLGTVKEVGDAAKKSWGGLSSVISVIGDAFKTLWNGIETAFNWLKDKFSHADKTISLQNFLSLINTGLFGYLVYHASTFIKAFKDIGAEFSDALGEVGDTLKAMQKQIIADAIKKIAVSIAILAGALIAVSLVPQSKLKGAVASIAALTTVLVLAFKAISGGSLSKVSGKSLIKQSGQIVATATAMEIMAAAVLTLAGAVAIFGHMKTDTLLKGGLAIAAVLYGLTVSFIAISEFGGAKTIIATGGSIFIIANALLILASAIKLFSEIDGETLKNGGLKIAGVMIVLLAILNGFDASLPGAAAVFVVASALVVLAGALNAFEGVSIVGIAKGLGVLAAVIIGFGVASLIFAEVIPLMLGFAGAIALLGVGIFAIGAGILLLSAGLAALAVSGTAGLAVLNAAILTFLQTLPIIFEQVALGVVAFAETIAKYSPRIVNAFVTVINNMLGAIPKVLPKFGDAVRLLIQEFIKTVASMEQDLIQTGIQFVLDLLTGIDANIGKIIKKGADVVIDFINGLQKNYNRVIDAGFDAIINFINGIADSIDKHSEELGEAGGHLASAIVEGLVNGLKAAGGEVLDTIKSLGGGAVGKLAGVLGISSPSKITHQFGVYTAQGLANGLDTYAKTVDKSAENLGKNALAKLKASLRGASNAAPTGDMSINPVISPVLDLSNITRDAPLIHKALSGASISADLSYKNASSVSTQVEAVKEAIAALIESQQNQPKEVKFEQNNYSPKALTSAEIYRNTKSQLALAKEAL